MISIGLWTFSSDIITVVLGPEFISGAEVLRWFSLVVVASFVNTLLSSFLKATDRQKVDMVIAIVVLMANLVMNLLLVPGSGMLGSVWAVLISELFACCARGCVAGGLVRKVAWRRALFLPALAALVALGFCILIRDIPLFFAVPIAGIFMLLLGIPVGLYSSARDLEVSTSRE
jgi:O-antigen/teichoic acid export membrane protein